MRRAAARPLCGKLASRAMLSKSFGLAPVRNRHHSSTVYALTKASG
jgi:hypothetical protein